MSDQNTNPYRAELEALAAKPKWELCYGSRKRKIPQAVLRMYACPLCFVLTVGTFGCFILSIFSFSWYVLNLFVLVAISASAIAMLVSHIKSHLHVGTAEWMGLGSSCVLPTEMVNYIERWIATHPMTIDAVETPWRSIKSISDNSRGRVSASLVIPIECHTFINGFSPMIERELNLTIDATVSSTGGTDVKVSVQFTAIDQEQCNQTIAAVVGSIITGVVMQEVLQIGGARIPIKWCFPEPVWSRDDVRFRASVRGTLIASPRNEANEEQRLEYVLRDIQSVVSIVANEMDSSILRDDPVSLKVAASSRMSDISLAYDLAFELENIQLDELEKLELPMPMKEPIFSLPNDL